MLTNWLQPLRDRLRQRLEELGLRPRLAPCYVRADRRVQRGGRGITAPGREHHWRARQRLS